MSDLRIKYLVIQGIMTQYLITVRFTRESDAPAHLYLLEGELAPDELQRLTSELLHDPVVQEADWCALEDLADVESSVAFVPAQARVSRRSPALSDVEGFVVEVAFKPGVTDN